MPRLCTKIHRLKKLQLWCVRTALAGPACTGQPSTPDWPAGSTRARKAPAAAKTDSVLLRAALASLNAGLAPLKADSFSESGVFDGEYGWSDERDSEIYKTFGSGFGKKIEVIIKDLEQEALPCWEGPISGRLGYYVVCIEEVIITAPPPLDQVSEEVINDWRLSNISNP